MTIEEFPVLDTLPVGVCILDRLYRVRFWNRPLEHWTGFSRSELEGNVLTEIFPGLSQDRYVTRFEQVLTTGLPAVFSSQLHKALLPCQRPGGRLRDQQTTVTRLRLEEGYGLAMAVEDVSSLSDIIRRNRRVRKKLDSQREYLQLFASAAAHDLQAPLRHISGFSKILGDSLENEMSEEVSLCLDMISNSVQSLQSLISDLLTHAQAGVGSPPCSVDLNSVLDQALFNLGLTKHNSQIEAADLPRVQGNRAALIQVLQNLVSNALKYRSNRSPLVRIRAMREKGRVLLSVQDNGKGIRDADLQRIFLPFQRSCPHPDIPGTGLGLSTCRQALEIHGGEIWAESTLGVGSIFWLNLPEAYQEAA